MRARPPRGATARSARGPRDSPRSSPPKPRLLSPSAGTGRPCGGHEARRDEQIGAFAEHSVGNVDAVVGPSVPYFATGGSRHVSLCPRGSRRVKPTPCRSSDGVVVQRATSAGGIAEQETGFRSLATIASTISEDRTDKKIGPTKALSRPAASTPAPSFRKELLDAPARAAYRQRLTDLEAELAEATQWADTGRAAKLREEIEFLGERTLGRLRARGPGAQSRRRRRPGAQGGHQPHPREHRPDREGASGARAPLRERDPHRDLLQLPARPPVPLGGLTPPGTWIVDIRCGLSMGCGRRYHRSYSSP